MSTFAMTGADPAVLVHHMAFYGLADILETSGITDLRMRWDHSTPTLDGDGLAPDVVDAAVRAHVTGRSPWVGQSLGADKRGVMSPRLTVLKTDEAWSELRDARHAVLQQLTDQHAWSDLRYLAALGEPAYWSRNIRGEVLQDDGASRWEMQPRNRGSEFVGNRLRPLIDKLAARPAGTIAGGLDGSSVRDELGGKPDSVSATGLTTPGPVDNAVVWCALWAIGQFPLAPRINHTALTSGHLGRPRREWFTTPYWTTPWRPARLRTILAARQLSTAACAGLPDLADPLAVRAAQTWLHARGADAVARFPIGRFGSDNAPERRALRAELLPTATPR
ncbi:hypothetical protein [Pseudonocardia phyllosphaerae]|uniref:hypothetical protein n=1 Tax=Pseudonocardia phyllosphaerae TaxID=3390502 RepID=UPI00397C6E7D